MQALHVARNYESSLLDRDGNDFKVYLRLHEKSVVSGTFDVYLSIAYRILADSRLLNSSRSDRYRRGRHAIPVGTRKVLITVTFTRLSGFDNDGLADNLSSA